MVTLQPVEVIQKMGQAATLLNPMRLKMLERLAEPESASGLAREMDMPRQKVNYHLRELEKVGLVEFIEERKKGNCMERVVRATARSYLISPEVLGSLGQNPDEIQDRFSSSYLVATAAKTLKDVAILKERAKLAGKKLPTMTLQTEIKFASARDRDNFVEELTNDIARLTAKYHDENAKGGRIFNFVINSYPKITKAS